MLSRDDVEADRFYSDHAGARIYFADDPTGRKVEARWPCSRPRAGRPTC